MPPKPKFTRDEIAAKALEIIRTQGNSEFTARKLGAALGVSSRPLFTAFKNMEEIRHAAREIAMREFEEFGANYSKDEIPFKKIGMNMIDYAINQPEMFKLIFMEESAKKRTINDIMNNLGMLSDASLQILKENYGLDNEQAHALFEQVWVYTFGIASLCAMKVCNFTPEEISQRLTSVFMSTLEHIKKQK